MRLVVISGRSGSGKSTALHVLEDVGFTCIDNLPVGLLPKLFEQIGQRGEGGPQRIAIGIDARDLFGDLEKIPDILAQVENSNVQYEVVFLDATSPTLIQRFSETRRKHPLSNDKLGLKEAIERERQLLDPISSIAHRHLDTSHLNLHQLRDVIKTQIAPESVGEMAILFQSFAFKRGVPVDADFVFDVRHLPNPYWKMELRAFTGNDQPVVEFLESQSEVIAMLADINGFLTRWLPNLQASNRSYLTIAIGCTGGQHRSVYICNRLGEYFSDRFSNIQVRHRELG